MSLSFWNAEQNKKHEFALFRIFTSRLPQSVRDKYRSRFDRGYVQSRIFKNGETLILTIQSALNANNRMYTTILLRVDLEPRSYDFALSPIETRRANGSGSLTILELQMFQWRKEGDYFHHKFCGVNFELVEVARYFLRRVFTINPMSFLPPSRILGYEFCRQFALLIYLFVTSASIIQMSTSAAFAPSTLLLCRRR